MTYVWYITARSMPPVYELYEASSMSVKASGKIDEPPHLLAEA